jgi:transposase
MEPFPPGFGGGEQVEHGYKGKGVLVHLLIDGEGMPLSFSTTSAKGDERKELASLITALPRKRRSIGFLQADKGYDSQWIRKFLIGKFYYPLIPYRVFNKPKSFKSVFKKLSTRWKIERTFAWLKRRYRRLCARWERKQCVFEGFIFVALIMMWVNKLIG